MAPLLVGRVNILRKLILKQHTTLTASFIRTYWNKDFKPGPYPKTPEERAAAAKKYGLLPEDYEPYPDDGYGYGDYPKLPDVSADARDPFYNWDSPELRRNFGEPIHVQADMYGEDRYNINAKPLISYNMQALIFCSIMALAFGLFYLGDQFKYEKKVMPKYYPEDGVTHYTFEPANK